MKKCVLMVLGHWLLVACSDIMPPNSPNECAYVGRYSTKCKHEIKSNNPNLIPTELERNHQKFKEEMFKKQLEKQGK